jgi:hypothetical protein
VSSSELEISDEGKTETVKSEQRNAGEQSGREYGNAVCTRWVLFLKINEMSAGEWDESSSKRPPSRGAVT